MIISYISSGLHHFRCGVFVIQFIYTSAFVDHVVFMRLLDDLVVDVFQLGL